MNYLLDRKKMFFVVFLVLIIIVGIVYSLVSRFQSKPVEEIIMENNSAQTNSADQEFSTKLTNGTISITNLKQTSPSSDPSIRVNAGKILYRQVTKMENEKLIISGNVREGSFSQTQTSESIYRDKMIIDIPELKQSWGLIYFWSNTKPINGDHIFSACLDEADLIYGKFDCQSSSKRMSEW